MPVVGAEVWRSGAAAEPEAGPAPACPCCALCVCVCQAVPVLPVRTGCELVTPCRVLVPGGTGWCLQGRLEESRVQPAPGTSRWSPRGHLRGCSAVSVPAVDAEEHVLSYPAGTRGTCVRVCVRVFVHEGYYLMSILALSTH